MFCLLSCHPERVVGQTDTDISEWSAGLRKFCYKVAGGRDRCQGPSLLLVGKADRMCEKGALDSAFLHLISPVSFLQVNVKRPLRDETHFEVVESGRYVILLLGQALSVVWDHHLSISVVLKHTYQVSWPSCCILPVIHVD